MAEVEVAPTAAAAKPHVEKKAKVPKGKKPKEAKPAPAHPPYFQMIKEAIVALQEKSGSSAYAIAKHMELKYQAVLPANYKKMLALQLKHAAVRGKLVKVKASFKLADLPKKKAPAKKRAAVAVAAAEPKATRKRAPAAKKQAVKKTLKKKPVAAKPKAKSIRSAKSAVAKKSRRAS
ncbi:unnamed protein product [Victoria cruziana]